MHNLAHKILQRNHAPQAQQLVAAHSALYGVARLVVAFVFVVSCSELCCGSDIGYFAVFYVYSTYKV